MHEITDKALGQGTLRGARLVRHRQIKTSGSVLDANACSLIRLQAVLHFDAGTLSINRLGTDRRYN